MDVFASLERQHVVDIQVSQNRIQVRGDKIALEAACKQIHRYIQTVSSVQQEQEQHRRLA